MKIHSHIFFWIMMMLLMIFLVPVVMPPETAIARVTAEQKATADVFGVAVANEMTASANKIYRFVVGDTWVGRTIQTLYTTREDIKSNAIGRTTNENMGSMFNRYLWSMSLLIYGMVLRANIMLHWLYYIGIFLFAVIMDGQMQRKVKYAHVQAISPAKFSVALHSVIAITFMPLVYLTLPIHVTPWFMPIWTLIVAYPLAKAISNAAGFD